MRLFPVTYGAILDDLNADALLREYADECANAELGEVNPQRDLYAAMEKSGGMQCFAVYSDDLTTLVGFAAVLIWVVPHYGTKIAAPESIFIASAHRSGGTGEELRRHLKRFAKGKGCQVFQWTAPVGSQFDALLSLDDKCRYSNNVYLETL